MSGKPQGKNDTSRVPLNTPKIVVDLAEETRRRRFAEKMRALQGTLHLNLDIDELRGRNRDQRN